MNVYAQAWDCPMVTYGPGDSDLDHAPNEHLKLDEYDRSLEVLETVTRRLLED
jgi:LysW-gamma-L-lysine carboxypeptidase